MRVVVAGGAGFIGSHLCDRLVAQGHFVLCIDNLLTGSRDNIAHLLKNDRFQFIEADIISGWSKATSQLGGRVEAIFHLASPASPVDYKEHPLETLLANSQGTQHLLELAHRDGAGFLLASTSEIYGDPLEHPQKESYWGNVNPIGERSCYDESKRFAESMTMVFRRLFAVDARIVRIFNTYGPRLQRDDGRVISNFINQALTDKPLTMYGDGSQTRSFCYVSDMVEGLVQAMFLTNTAGEVFNLGNPDEFTIQQLAEMINGFFGGKVAITRHPLPPDDPKKRQPDITKARTVLGWQPQVSLKEGLEKTIAYFRGAR